MPAAPLPLNEAARLAALRRYGILDSESSPAFDALTRLAARLFDVPVAVVSLVDEDRQWFKARVGMDACQTPRDHAFCAWALLEPDILEVLDPLGDPRFADNPLVTGDMRVRYYAGAPLINPDGLVMGTLCLFDTRRRPALSEQQRETLRTLADAVMGELNQHAARLQSDLALSAARDLNTLARERLSGLAESFNTPLTALLGYGQLLYSATHTGSSDPKLETLGRYADAIQSAGKSLLELVNTTLEAMRAHHGSIDQNNAGSVANLHSLLDEVHTLTAPLAEQRGMTMRLSLTSPLWVKGDPIRLKQMVLALVANALKHAGRGVIDLNAHPSDDGRTITLTVSDQGPGLPPAMASLLDPAPLTDPALLAHRGGLTVVRTMAAMQGFGLAVTSTPGIGCMVQINARRHQPELVSA
ncbi:GAF domain-containing sensor histidine kinase [Insolitispirillum peregrinum]|uniref:histidine kinase n=1 Tax=Insolitispirillum peregrinum TaxID=80876 RepID=A0A1N7L730_9PROT|nr:GAF domain-containing sensor histidine kinase [Insolitispirillum peregrinum]SIS69490.1 Signal transduction histidine kinase [Insolitispirillum peregrinum]